jgi:hypothetical protein
MKVGSSVRSLARAVGLAAATCALGLVCAGGSAAAEAVVPVEGPWTGTTSVGLPVHFEVEGDNVLDATFGFHWGECGNFTSREPNTDPIDPEGHWSFDAPEGQTIEGSFIAPDRVEGRVVTVERTTPGCPETHAGFVAVPGEIPPPTAPQIYAVQNVITGYKERSPTWIFLGRGGSFLIGTLTWQDFGKSVAHATGEAGIRRFKREWSPKAVVTLSRPIPDGAGRDIYSRLRFSLHGSVPPRFPHKGWFKFDRHGVVASSDSRWPGGPGYTGRHSRG